MAKKTFLHRGLVTKLDEKFGKIGGLFNLDRWFRDTAKFYSVTTFDPCCPEANGGAFPVRVMDMGEGGLQLQRFDGTEWVSVDASQFGISGVTQSIVIPEVGTMTFDNGILVGFED